MRDDIAIRIQIAQPLGGGGNFVFADGADAKQNLPLQITRTDDINIGQTDGSNTCRCEILTDRATQTARADAEHLCIEQFFLPFNADLRKNQMPFVAIDLFVSK